MHFTLDDLKKTSYEALDVGDTINSYEESEGGYVIKQITEKKEGQLGSKILVLTGMLSPVTSEELINTIEEKEDAPKISFFQKLFGKKVN